MTYDYTQTKPAAPGYLEIVDQYCTYYVVLPEAEVVAALAYFRETYDWNCDGDMSAEELAAFLDNDPNPVSRYEYHA